MLTHDEEGSYKWAGHGVDVPVRATARERRAIIDAMETAIIEDIELHGDSPS
jgi:actin-like ATPase involved in cell morphogenesis